MTVKELIEKLQEMDPELPVLYHDMEFGPSAIDKVTVWDNAIIKSHYHWGTMTVEVMRNGKLEVDERPHQFVTQEHIKGVVLE